MEGGDFQHLSRRGTHSLLHNGYRVFPGVTDGRRVTLTTHPLLVLWSRKSRAIPPLPLWTVRPVQNLSACTVQLYLYSPCGPYGLYRASVPVQYSYTSTPPVGRTACTEPQCLYSTAIPLIPLRAVRPVQNLSACTRVHFTFAFLGYFASEVAHPHIFRHFVKCTQTHTDNRRWAP